MTEIDDYESLPASYNVTTHMMAGSLAGISEHSIMYPIDCVKTRMQCLVPHPKANYRNVLDALYRIIRYEGLFRTIRGVQAVVIGAGPAHAMYFACYESVKKVLSSPQYGHYHHIAHGVAGCCATLLHDAVMNPADVVKQRMQMYASPYKTCLECGQNIVRREGFKAFYWSYTTQLTMNIPFQTIHFMVYETCQDYLNDGRAYKPSSHLISGALAGGLAAAVTTPLDVCKTLLNTQEECAVVHSKNAISGLFLAFRTVYRFRGFRGYFRGLQARVIFQMPSTAISWSVYEFLKYFITKHRHLSAGTSDGHKIPSPNLSVLVPTSPVSVRSTE